MSDPLNSIDNVPLPNNDQMVQLGVGNFGTTISGYRDAFITNAEIIDPVRWNRLYPYQLVVCKSAGNGYYEPTAMKFTLPMTPQELSIQTPFAISNTITADGVAEEHNGVKVKNIQLSGTLGSAPLRGSSDIYTIDPEGAEGLRRLIAGGTIDAIRGVQQAGNDFQDLATGDGAPRVADNYIKPYSPDPKIEATYKSTGYVQHLLLDQFLQGYAALKTRPEGKDLRLAFCIWKDDTTYLVTPISYAINRSASSPGEYMYDLQLKAWKKVELNGVLHTPFTVAPRANRWTANRALKTLHAARDAIYAGKQTVEAVRGDADRLMSIVRETILAARDATGVAQTVLDMPATLKDDYKILIEKQAQNLYEDIKALGNTAEEWTQVL
jgi:hypothetical protein